jgi:hypothetical protein
MVSMRFYPFNLWLALQSGAVLRADGQVLARLFALSQQQAGM